MGNIMLFSKDPQMMDTYSDRELKKAITKAKKEFYQENNKRKIEEVNKEVDVSKKSKFSLNLS